MLAKIAFQALVVAFLAAIPTMFMIETDCNPPLIVKAVLGFLIMGGAAVFVIAGSIGFSIAIWS